MYKKCIIFIVMLMMTLTSIVIEPDEENVKAYTDPGNKDIGLDYSYIFNITKDLSDIIKKYPPGMLEKGRAFGTWGEHFAAEYLATNQMNENLSLYGPTDNTISPYYDELEKNRPFLFFRHYYFYKWITSKFIIVDKELKVNNTVIDECYITPSWGHKSKIRLLGFIRPFYQMKKRLTNTYSYSDLKVVPDTNKFIQVFNEFWEAEIEGNYSFEEFEKLQLFFPILLLRFEKYWGFNFSDLNETNLPDKLPYYNDTYPEEMRLGNNMVVLRENPAFNIDIEKKHPRRKYAEYLEAFKFWFVMRWVKGIVLFDNNQYVPTDVFNNDLGAYMFTPTIFINKDLGSRMYENPDDHTISFTLKQKWTNDVESYNVIGQINGTDTDKTVIIGCLYDSWWNQGTADSAIGIGIILSIAKYMKELENQNILPKYNVKFIAFGGEEYGMRGAYSYEDEHRKEKIVAMIDLNQLGFKQEEPELYFNIVATNKYERDLARNIFEKTNFDYRMNNSDPVPYALWTTKYENNRRKPEPKKGEWHYISDYRPFSDSRYQKINRRKYPIKILSFVKARTLDNGEFKYAWGLHHRDGENHDDGDVMEYYDSKEVNLTTEVIWNFTKFYTINPNCWFTDFSTDLIDTGDPSAYPDTVNVSFSIKSRIPHDRILVRAILWSQDHPILFRKMEEKNYIITASGIEDNLLISLPNYFPSGKYTLWVFLYNSTGEVRNDMFFDNTPYPKEMDFGYFDNDSEEEKDLFMEPANNAPGGASQPSANINTNVQSGTQYFYTAGAVDPEGDQVFYQWDFGDSQVGHDYSSSFGMFNSGTNQTIGHTWTSTGEKQVRVRAIDKWYGMDRWGNWSDPLNVSVGPGCGITVGSTTILVNQNVNLSGVNYEFDFGQRENPTWDWEFGNGNTSTVQDTSQIYNKTNEYIINLTLVNDTGGNVSYSITINVVNLSADFNMDQECTQPNVNISFTNLSIGVNSITNWTWDFGDGNTSYDVNPVHNYSSDGNYNVTLTVIDGLGNSSNITKIVRIDSVDPLTLLLFFSQSPVSSMTTSPSSDTFSVGFNSDVAFYCDLYDERSGINSINISITNPDNISWNYTLVTNSSHPYGHEFVFDNTSRTGWYNYTYWVKDKAGNINNSTQGVFMVSHLFGYPKHGDSYQNIDDRITGSVFTVYEKGTADNVYAYIQTNHSTPPKTKCMIYRKNDSKYIGTTEEKTINTGDDPKWVVYNFTGTKPGLVNDTEYVLVCWANDPCNISYENCSNVGKYDSETYGSPPDPAVFVNENRLYSIYCCYSTKPRIADVAHTPGTVGFGFPVNISVNVTDDVSGIDSVSVNITFPTNDTYNISMNNTGNDTYEYSFTGTWLTGTYNYSIRAVDRLGGVNCSSVYNFTVSANATISVCTIKDSYSNNNTVNLTDPPGNPPSIGYELLDNGDVLHIWNEHNSYYFNTSSGIQLTNHYNEYWSHNVLMLGYYNNDKWNLIYRTDELSGFSRNIDTDNQTFVNVTLWKDLTYKGYDFRLAIRYHLGSNDHDLTVIPYIKNLGDAIPYTLAFGWEIKDIKIANTYENDRIRLYNGTNWVNYSLDQTLNNTYDDMDYNTTFILEGLNEGVYFRRTLYLKWNHTLDYILRVKSRDGQNNAPVTLFIKIGTLADNQEKYTMMNWLDSDEWLGVDSQNYHSSCGYEGPIGPPAALDGVDAWAHLNTENHWLVIDLLNPYYIKKLRGRSDTGNDPTSVDIYISNDPNNWGSAVHTGITTWQDTSTWAEVDITDTVGRYINISITSTEGGAGTDYLEFGGIPTPMTIFDVYGDKLASAMYYFNTNYDQSEEWATNPSYMVDGSTANYASTTFDGDVQLCMTNTCPGTDIGKILKVEMRAYGYYTSDQRDIILRPVFAGTTDGGNYNYQTTTTQGWSPWFDITDDNSAPGSWSWIDVKDLDCDVEAGSGLPPFTLYCSKIEIMVTYATVPEISNPIPADGSIGISLTPTLNITVADLEGDTMNITWLSNSSGSWQVFGTNNSVGNGTYHQVFSNATVNGKWWYWKVNVSDNTSYNESSIYKFYTGYQSKIKNTGSTDISGYLMFEIQYYNETSENWEIDLSYGEPEARIINSSEELGIDMIFNGNLNTSDLSFGNGTYRIYVAFMDDEYNVLKCDDETEMIATYEFTVTF
jgi:PKD repeat protein